MIQIELLERGFAVTTSVGRISNFYKAEHDARCALRRMIRTRSIEFLPRGKSECVVREELQAARQQLISAARALHDEYGSLTIGPVSSPAEYIAAGNAAACARGWPPAARDTLKETALCLIGDANDIARIYNGL